MGTLLEGASGVRTLQKGRDAPRGCLKKKRMFDFPKLDFLYPKCLLSNYPFNFHRGTPPAGRLFSMESLSTLAGGAARADSMPQSGSVWLGLAQSGSIWFNLAQSGSIWLSMAQYGSVWLNLALSG